MNNYIDPDYEDYINEEFYKDYTYNRHQQVAHQNQRVDSIKQPGRIERQGSLLSGTFHMLL